MVSVRPHGNLTVIKNDEQKHCLLAHWIQKFIVSAVIFFNFKIKMKSSTQLINLYHFYLTCAYIPYYIRYLTCAMREVFRAELLVQYLDQGHPWNLRIGEMWSLEHKLEACRQKGCQHANLKRCKIWLHLT